MAVENINEDSENPGLGVVLTIIQISVFFAFIAYCALGNPSLTTAQLESETPRVFIYGLAVIIIGTALTALYVIVTNREAQR